VGRDRAVPPDNEMSWSRGLAGRCVGATKETGGEEKVVKGKEGKHQSRKALSRVRDCKGFRERVAKKSGRTDLNSPGGLSRSESPLGYDAGRSREEENERNLSNWKEKSGPEGGGSKKNDHQPRGSEE